MRVLLFLAAILPAALTAQTVVQTLTFDSDDFTVASASGTYTPTFSGTINQFDAILGTLDSIDFAFSFTFTGSTQLGAGGGGISVSASGSAYWDTTLLGGGSNGSGGGGGPFAIVPFGVTIVKNYSTGTLTLAEATGTGTASFSLDTSVSAPTGASLQLDNGTLSLTYNYTPAAVPEPSRYVFIAGLSAMAVAIVRRRSVVA